MLFQMLFQMLGLIGALFEDFFLTCLYVVLQVLGIIVENYTLQYSIFLINAVFSFFSSIVAVLFLIDLILIKNSKKISYWLTINNIA